MRTKQDRFIAGYIQTKYSKIYKEAEDYYKQLNSQYPNKRDLTKTQEFLYLSTGYKTFTCYYKERHQAKKKQKTQTDDNMEMHQAKKKQKTHADNNMELKIPLMSSEDVAIQQEPLDMSDQTYESLITELRKDPDLYAIFNDMNIEVNIPKTQEQGDQNTEQIFDDLETLWPGLLDGEPTPLEKELTLQGF